MCNSSHTPMIDKVLKQIVEGLNNYLGPIYDPGLTSYEGLYAEVRHLKKDSFSNTGSKKIAVNLINIEEEKVYKNQPNPFHRANPTDPTLPLGGVPAMRIKMYLLFAFHPGETAEHYAEALSLLTHVLRYFQGTPYQEIVIPGNPPSTFNLEINYHNISLEDSNNMWSNLGGEQKPYAMYQVQLLEIEPGIPATLTAVIQEPRISNPQYNSNGEIIYNTQGDPLNDDHSIQHKN